MRRRIVQSSLVVAVALACLASGASAGGWLSASPPTTVANGPSGAVVAVSPAGDAIAAWTDDGGGGIQSLVVATRPAGGPWSTPEPLASDVGVDAPAVTIDAAGNATVVWTESADGSAYAARAARRDAASGSWSAPHDFPPAARGVADPLTQVRADALGNVVAAWVEHDVDSGVAFVRGAVASDAGESWSVPTTISDPADAWVAFDRPQIAPDATGGALVAWTAQRIATSDYAIETSTRLAGVWSSPATLLPDVGETVSPVRMVGTEDGDAVATWFQGSPAALWGAYRLNGNWNVGGVSDDVAPACVPLQALGADDDAGATVVWKADSTAGLEAVPLTVGGTESQTTVYGARDMTAEDAAIEHGTIVFVVHDAGSDTDSALASRREGDGSWSAPALLAGASAGTGLSGPDVATDSDGDALASWTATDGLGAKSVAAAAFQAAGPRLDAVSVPASGTAGTQLAFSATARSTFASVAQTSWDFGDGSAPVAGATVAHVYAGAGTYTVTVTATDSVGNATSATRQVVVAAAPGTTPPPGDGGSLLRPRIGGAPAGVLVLPRKTRTLKLLVRNPNSATLRGSIALVRPRLGRRPALTLAVRRRVRFAGRRRTTVTLRLTDQALRALKGASGYRLPVKAALHVRAADSRRASATLAATLDASARFAGVGTRVPTARKAC